MIYFRESNGTRKLNSEYIQLSYLENILLWVNRLVTRHRLYPCKVPVESRRLLTTSIPDLLHVRGSRNLLSSLYKLRRYRTCHWHNDNHVSLSLSEAADPIQPRSLSLSVSIYLDQITSSRRYRRTMCKFVSSRIMNKSAWKFHMQASRKIFLQEPSSR